MKIFETVISYLKQPSTWRGIVAILTAAGIALEPAQVEAITVAGVALIGVIEVFRNEKPAA
jgi:hypothetical protein